MKKRLCMLLLAAVLAVPNLLATGKTTAYAQENDKTGLESMEETELSRRQFNEFIDDNEKPAADALENGAQVVESGTHNVVTFTKVSHANAVNGVYASYTTDKLYQTMTSAQKKLYDRLYTTCESYLISDAELYYSDYVGGYCTAPVQYSGLSDREAVDILLCFAYSNPQFYYLANGYVSGTNSSGKYFMLQCYREFANGSTRATYTNRVFSEARKIIDAANAKSNIYDKLRTAEVMIGQKATYAELANGWDQSCCGILLKNTGVCASYSETYELICNALGVPTIAVTSIEHEWNQVYINGAWYVVDATWDDNNTYGTVDADYFLKSYSTINNYSSADRTNHTIETDVWATVSVPDCRYDFVESNNTSWEPAQTTLYEAEQSSFTGMAYVNNTWRYLVNGVVDYNYTGMANNEYGWWYFVNGQLDWSYTGLGVNQYGTWVYENGNLNFGRNGMVCVDGTWRYAVNGQITNYTGMACNEYGWWYYQNGLLDWTYTGMACNDYGWWYYQNGRLDWNYTGAASNQYGVWYYMNGNINWGYSGMLEIYGNWWYVVNGQFIMDYTGMACNEWGWWYYTNGNINWNYTGMACNDYGWWYYQNGRLDWNYTGFGYNQYGTWLYYNGQIAWGYTGDWYGHWVEGGQVMS
ncbi:MAG: hypothetical protein IJ655_02715 [Lachnospiraceae bacterium]|nr:hypothetical protein [Lachnospiraceae bacterium]